MALVVGELGVFSQSQLHGRRGLEHHGVHPAAVGLQGGKLAADGVGGARSGEAPWSPRLPGLLEAAVHRVHRVHRPQVGGTGIGGLIAVVPFDAPPSPNIPRWQWASIKPGAGCGRPGVKDPSLPIRGILLHGANLGDLYRRDMATYPPGMVSPSMVWTVPLMISIGSPFSGGRIRPPSR